MLSQEHLKSTSIVTIKDLVMSGDIPVFAIFSKDNKSIIDYGVIKTDSKDPLCNRLKVLHEDLEYIIKNTATGNDFEKHRKHAGNPSLQSA